MCHNDRVNNNHNSPVYAFPILRPVCTKFTKTVQLLHAGGNDIRADNVFVVESSLGVSWLSIMCTDAVVLPAAPYNYWHGLWLVFIGVSMFKGFIITAFYWPVSDSLAILCADIVHLDTFQKHPVPEFWHWVCPISKILNYNILLVAFLHYTISWMH